MSKTGNPPTDADTRDAKDAQIATLARHALDRKHAALPTPSDLDDELLLRYVDGTIGKTERDGLERRLLLDLDAKERIGILVGALGDAAVQRANVTAPDTAIARGAQAVSRYVFHLAGGLVELLRGGEGATALQPAMSVRAGAAASMGDVRPSAFQIERVFQSALGTFPTRVELHAESGDQSALADLVVHVGAESSAAAGVRCKLLRDGRAIDSREMEERGCTFARLGPGRYDIELRKGGIEIGRLQLDLRG